MTKPRRRIWRWAKRLVLGTIASVLVLVGFVVIAVHTNWGRDQIRKRVEAALQDTFPGGATIGSLEGSVFGELTIRDIELRSIDGKPAITVGTLTVELALAPLFDKIARVESLVAEDVQIVAGGAPLTKPDEEVEEDDDDDSPGWSVSLPAIQVKRGSVAIVGKQPITLDEVTLAGGVELPAGKPIDLDLAVQATWRERGLPVDAKVKVTLAETTVIPEATATVGGVRVAARALSLEAEHSTGTLEVTGTAAALRAIDPRIDLPADIALTVTASRLTAEPAPGSTRGRRSTLLDIDGTLGATRVNGAIRGSPRGRWADVYLGVGAVDVGKLTQGQVIGHGEVALALRVDRTGVRGIAGVRGVALELPASNATLVIDSTWERAKLVVFATDGEAQVAAVATAARDPKTKVVTLEQARVVARGRDFAQATGGRVALKSRGDLRAEVWLDKPGTLLPVLALSGRARVSATGVAYDDLRVAGVDITARGELAGKTVTGTADIDARNVTRAGTALGSARAQAMYLKDGRIRANVKAQPAAVPIVVEVAGDVTLGTVVEIVLADHKVTPQKGNPWVGKGGRIAVGDEITIRGFTTTNGSGRAAIDATVVTATGAIDGTIGITDMPATLLDPKAKGTASGKLAIKRRGTTWDGTGDFTARELVLAPDAPVVNGTAHLELHGRKVTLDAHATSPTIGGVRFELDVDGPRDITDVIAWQRLDRAAIKVARITVEKVTLASVTPTGGTVDGNLQLAGPDTTVNTVTIGGVQTPLGIAAGQVAFSPVGDDLFAAWNANVSDVGEAKVNVHVRFPKHPFDPAEWSQLGRGVVRSVVASFEDIAIDPVKLEKLGVRNVPYRGRADVKLAVGAAGTAAKVDVDARQIEGGTLRHPIDVHVEARTDEVDTKACAWIVRAGAKHRPVDGETDKLCADAPAARLLALEDAVTPVTFSTWANAPKAAIAAALAGKLVIPSQSAPALLAVVGRDDFDPKKGTIDGMLVFKGTLGKPGVAGAITARNLGLISTLASREIPELEELKIVADWNGLGGKLEVTATEQQVAPRLRKGTLVASITGRVDQLMDGVLAFRANELDLAPLAAFLPGELAATKGVLNATVLVAGLDLATARIRGDMRIREGYLPIAPVIGTLNNAHVSVRVTDDGIRGDAYGILNTCRGPRASCTENVRLEATAPHDLSTLSALLTVRQVSTIGEIEPIIDAKAKVELRRTGRKWTGSIDVTGGVVEVPESVGDDLLEADDPDDVYFVENPPPQSLFDRAREPERIWLEAKLNIASTRIGVKEYGVNARVHSEGLVVRIGDTIGLDGKLRIESGMADDIFGRQYTIEQNEIVSFDGTIDPDVNLQLSHLFNDAGLLLVVRVQGKPSDDDFPHATFDSDPPGRYSQGELFSFFLGGNPSGDVASQTKEAGIGVGASVLSQAIAKRLKKYMPKKLTLDVIKCEPGTTAAGASCTFGKRFLDDDLYIAYKRRLAALPNENADEAQIQYYLSREWFLEGVGGSANIIGADLLWRRRW